MEKKIGYDILQMKNSGISRCFFPENVSVSSKCTMTIMILSCPNNKMLTCCEIYTWLSLDLTCTD